MGQVDGQYTLDAVTEVFEGRRHEPIVRCRDCRHYHATYNGCDEFGDIWHDEYATVEPYGFCAWGERRSC